MKNRKLIVATCQHPVSSELKENLKHIIRLLERSREEGADIAHFPECNLVGYGGYQLKEIRPESFDEVKTSIELIKDKVQNLGMTVIIGTHFFENLKDTKPKNCLLLIDSSGNIKARYSKRILTGSKGTMDHFYYSAGDSPVLFELEGIKCGLVICHEWRYPELYREYKRLGAELIFHSWFDGGLSKDAFAKNGKEEGDLIVGTVRGYAANNHLWVSGSNVANRESCFGSFVAQPDGQIVSQLRRNVTGLLTTEINAEHKFLDPSFFGRQRFL